MSCKPEISTGHPITKALTWRNTMNSKQRYNAQRAAEHRAKKAAARQFESGIVTTLMGCSLNVARATSAPSLREKHESTSQCLPEIAIFAAGYRKSKDIVTAR